MDNMAPTFTIGWIEDAKDIHRPVQSYAHSYPQGYPPRKRGDPSTSPNVVRTTFSANQMAAQPRTRNWTYSGSETPPKVRKLAKVGSNPSEIKQFEGDGLVSRETERLKSTGTTRVPAWDGWSVAELGTSTPRPGRLINKVIHSDIHRCSRTFQQQFVGVAGVGPSRQDQV